MLPINLGSGRTARSMTVGSEHVCAILDNGDLKCWGNNLFGQLGLGDKAPRGNKDGQMGDALPAVPLGTGRSARQVVAGAYHTCALLDDGTVKCWGSNTYGELGQGDTIFRGNAPGQMGDSLHSINLTF
jgi:alpha-tubulin suppressor-like RCC1 family protein